MPPLGPFHWERNVTLQDRQNFIQLFYSACLAITEKKGKDYNPDDIPMLEVLETAVDRDIEVLDVLWVYLRKHESAIKHFLTKGHVESEPIIERLRDATNFHALIAFYLTMQPELHKVWREYWGAQICVCESPENLYGNEMKYCQRCETLSWLEKRAFAIGSKTI